MAVQADEELVMIVSENIAELVTALSKAQGAMANVAKGSINPHFRSRYADLAAIRDVYRDPLAQNGLAIVHYPEFIDGAVEVTTILYHASGQHLGCCVRIPITQPTAQSIGSGQTYAKRYNTLGLLGLASEDEDDDGNAATASANGKGSVPGVTGPISPAQAEEIKMDIIHSGADLPRFLNTFGISRIEEMPAARFAEAKHKLDLKLQQTLAEERDEATDA
jgi:AcrR family transcriptional regulator